MSELNLYKSRLNVVIRSAYANGIPFDELESVTTNTTNEIISEIAKEIENGCVDVPNVEADIIEANNEIEGIYDQVMNEMQKFTDYIKTVENKKYYES